MDVRDQRLLQEVAARPFGGYARHDGAIVNATADRVLALVALLGAMLVSGVLLGSPARSR